MGITIHYSGKATSRAAVDKIMHTVMLMASEWDWPCAQVEDPDGEIARMREEVEGGGSGEFENAVLFADADDREEGGAEVYEGPVYMLVAQPGEGCEPLRLMFDRHWRMDGFTKTQYGPLETHVKICRVLRAIERHFEEFEVTDEAGFWESDDVKALKERRGDGYNSQDAAIAMYEAAKRKKALEDMYKIGGDDDEAEDEK